MFAGITGPAGAVAVIASPVAGASRRAATSGVFSAVADTAGNRRAGKGRARTAAGFLARNQRSARRTTRHAGFRPRRIRRGDAHLRAGVALHDNRGSEWVGALARIPQMGL